MSSSLGIKKYIQFRSTHAAAALALSVVIFLAINISIFLLDFKCLSLGDKYKFVGDAAFILAVVSFCAGQFWIVRIISVVALVMRNNWKKYALYAVLVLAIVEISGMLFFIDANYVVVK